MHFRRGKIFVNLFILSKNPFNFVSPSLKFKTHNSIIPTPTYSGLPNKSAASLINFSEIFYFSVSFTYTLMIKKCSYIIILIYLSEMMYGSPQSRLGWVFLSKVQLPIWNGNKNLKNSPACFDATEYLNLTTSGRFSKNLWPSHNILTLKFSFSEKTTKCAQSSLWFWNLLSKRQNHEDDCANI